GLGVHSDADFGWHYRKGNAPVWGPRGRRRAVASWSAQGQDVRSEAAVKVPGQCVIRGRQEAAVQGTRDLRNPVVVEGGKDARINAGPVVDRHERGLHLAAANKPMPILTDRVSKRGASSFQNARQGGYLLAQRSP